jgi:hypothetical protein
MMIRSAQAAVSALLIGFSLLAPRSISADPIAVRHTEGLVHGFLVLRTLDGDALAEGELIQILRSIRVTTRLWFRFKDGSVHDETAVFSQHGNFQLVSYHLIQRGPAFQHPIEVKIDVTSGRSRLRAPTTRVSRRRHPIISISRLISPTA